MIEYGSTLSKIIGNTVGFLMSVGLIIVVVETIFPEWFNKHIRKK